MIRPSFSQGGMIGVDGPLLDRPGSFRVGLYGQYEKNPLVLLVDGEEQGAIIADRLQLDLGLSYDVSRRLSLRVVAPVAMSTSSDDPLVAPLAATGFGFGDLVAGGRLSLVQNRKVALAAKADLALPVGTQDAWLGEQGARFTPGVLARVGLGDFSLGGELSVTVRSPFDTEAGFVNGSQLNLGVGARYKLIPEHLALVANGVTRVGFSEKGASGIEALVGARIFPVDAFAIDIAGGRGFGGGAGTTDLRALVGFTFTHKGPAPAVVPVEPELANNNVTPELLDALDPPDEPVMLDFNKPPEYQWKDTELARVEGQNILVREPVQFEQGTVRVLPASLPLLDQVADLIGVQTMLVIEGHASEEGDFDVNYELSERRARAIWEALVEAGVPPDRMSYRGVGEVAPVDGKDTDLAANRRVVFSLVRIQPIPGAAAVAPPTQFRLPWDGSDKTVRPSALPPPPVKPAEEVNP